MTHRIRPPPYAWGEGLGTRWVSRTPNEFVGNKVVRRVFRGQNHTLIQLYMQLVV